MPGVRRRGPCASPTAWSTSSQGAGRSRQTIPPSSLRSRDCGAGRTISAKQEGMMNTGVLDENLLGILDAVSDGVYVTTGERKIVFWSKGAERITGYSSDEVLNGHCYDNILIHTDVLGRTCVLTDVHCRNVSRPASGRRSRKSSSSGKTESGWLSISRRRSCRSETNGMAWRCSASSSRWLEVLLQSG